MTKLENVLYALNCRAIDIPSTCAECSYYNAEWCCCNTKYIMKDALNLLNAQMPRVVIENDVLHSIGKPLWFESRGKYLGQKGFWVLVFEVDPELHIRFVQQITGGKITLSMIDYGKIWRFWSTKPTEEQRKAVKWND